jgi:hypothetical protein
MYKKKILFIIFSLIVKSLFSQTQIGYQFDVNGYPFDGYHDPLIYSPKKTIKNIHNSDSYELGYYYDKNGTKIDGHIKYGKNKIWFKKDSSSKRIKAEEISSLVIGVDSFFTISNFKIFESYKKKPEFVQFLANINGALYVKHYRFTSDRVIETYLIKQKNNEEWNDITNCYIFDKEALKYFGHIPYLKRKISTGELTKDHMMTLITISDYQNKADKNQAIYFDSYWQEVITPSKATFSGTLINKTDSSWIMTYSKNGTKLYEVNYSSFYPDIKNGLYKSFYPDGSLRKEITYLNDMPKMAKSYEMNGELFSNYNHNQVILKKDTLNDIITYTNHNGIFDKNQIDTTKVISKNFYDKFTDKTFTQIFKKNQLVKSTYKLNSNIIYQITNPNYDLDISSLQNKFKNYMSNVNYEEALSIDAQGIILVSFTINDKGVITKNKILNQLHPELDQIIIEFLTKFGLNGNRSHKFQPYKIKKEKMYCEFVIPFEFIINRFYRKKNKYMFLRYMSRGYHYPHMITPMMFNPIGF